MPVFDGNGNEVPETTETPASAGALESPETPEEFDNADEPEAAGEVPEGEGKYKIGSKTFKTVAEATAYAESQISALETDRQVTDAYRQGIRDAISQSQPAPAQTEPEDDFDESEYYANPRDFLKKFAAKVETRVLGTVQQTAAQAAQAEAVWRDFGDRHPMYADKEFRGEIEGIANQHADTLKVIIATKGKDAAYDYCALKLKEKIDRYVQASKPSRKLSNASSGASPTPKGGGQGGVTPKPAAKKPETFHEQIMKIRKKR